MKTLSIVDIQWFYGSILIVNSFDYEMVLIVFLTSMKIRKLWERKRTHNWEKGVVSSAPKRARDEYGNGLANFDGTSRTDRHRLSCWELWGTAGLVAKDGCDVCSVHRDFHRNSLHDRNDQALVRRQDMNIILQDALYRAYLRWFGLYYGILAVLLLVGYPSDPVIYGLALGGAGSFMILTLQRLSVDRMYRVIERGRKPMSRGTVSRMAVAVLCVMIGLKYEAELSLTAVVIGLLAGHVIQFCEYFTHELKREKR